MLISMNRHRNVFEMRCDASEKVGDSHANRARELANLCKLAEAASLFGQWLTRDPYDLQATLDLAMISIELGQGERSKDLLVNLLVRNPNDARALTVLAAAYRRCEHDLRTCQAMLRQAFAIAPQDSRVLNGLGGLAATRGDFAAAFEWYNLAMEVDPGYPNPRHGLALAKSRIEHFKSSNEVLASMVDVAKLQDVISGVVFADARWLQQFNLFCIELQAAMKGGDCEHGV